MKIVRDGQPFVVTNPTRCAIRDALGARPRAIEIESCPEDPNSAYAYVGFETAAQPDAVTSVDGATMGSSQSTAEDETEGWETTKFRTGVGPGCVLLLAFERKAREVHPRILEAAERFFGHAAIGVVLSRVGDPATPRRTRRNLREALEAVVSFPERDLVVEVAEGSRAFAFLAGSMSRWDPLEPFAFAERTPDGEGFRAALFSWK